ncbi:ligase-associated DNA damage response endonuclease PdeM [Marivita sp. XM-24bin2]|jgi:DNA ligase-associated metallophosphoesterase|uniref:ligase-associated DNA damage response endonuclease PdeM n=1 Tax=unclassified Marivita TaxID=2632480 RepID=UPI000D7955FB|nr:ligase-associated DNA damage response endonuclease PdeM [Marivita sp. XM-24bin2]MCR9109391.1 ligase-associated DNA damage response endonuclease PdeM [Paracoccaceae bacterium]PWL35438.1 MAG: metallophosphoesterase [Marivita sp. XM-24bin2]
MNALEFSFRSETLNALPSGALFWPAQELLVVSDLHFGKSARAARFGGAQLPPYETTETLTRLANDLATTKARRVICLGDSFDAPILQSALPEADLLTLTTLQAGLDWTWIEGNHDPGPVQLGGTHRRSIAIGALQFRHIADPIPTPGEVTGHYHPKATLSLRGRALTRPCFLFDDKRLILPAYGAFTGGLHSHDPTLKCLMAANAQAILTGPKPCKIPMPGRAPLS